MEELSPEEQFQRCLSDNEDYLANRNRPDLTAEERAEHRCRKEMCFLMKCMANPARSHAKRDALTGELLPSRKCFSEQEKVSSCLARERSRES